MSTDPGYINPKHCINVGGFLPNRYTERQIPFFGFPSGFVNADPYTIVSQIDLRYNFNRKHYVTLRTAAFTDSFYLKDLFTLTPRLCYGAEYALRTFLGPLKIAVQYCDLNRFSAYASLGFEF